MAVEEHYKRIGLSLESHVRETYERGLDIIKGSDDPIRYLGELNLIIKALGGSRPGSDKIEWARDLIIAYRNLGRIFNTLLLEQGTHSTQLDEIFSGHEDLLEDFGEPQTPDAVNKALICLADVKGVLEKYEIEEYSGLRDELGELKRFREGLDEYGIEDLSGLRTALDEVEGLRTEIADLEEGLSEF